MELYGIVNINGSPNEIIMKQLRKPLNNLRTAIKMIEI